MKAAGFKIYASEADMYKQKFLAEKERADKTEMVCRLHHLKHALSYTSDELIECKPPPTFEEWMGTQFDKAKEVLGDE